MLFWVILHSLVWTGELSEDDDFPFPFSLISPFFQGTVSLKSKEANNYDEQLDNIGNYYDGYLSANDRISGSSLSEISLNNLYNFLTDPSPAAGNLFLAAGFVSDCLLFHLFPNQHSLQITIFLQVIKPHLFCVSRIHYFFFTKPDVI